MRTEISQIGKVATIDKLFESTGYINQINNSFKNIGDICTSQKVYSEGIDFDLVYNPLKHLGYKSVIGMVGEIYAEFYKPISLTVILGLSAKFSYENIAELWEGVVAGCKEHGIKNLSLDLVPSLNGLTINMSAIGARDDNKFDNIKAPQDFDLICLTGDVGAALMGNHVLAREKASFVDNDKQPDLSKYKFILASYLKPEINPNIVSRFLENDLIPSKGYFLSKGLAAAVKRLVRDTHLGAKIYVEKIPIASETFAMAKEINMDAVTAAMNGGDDYKFIFVVPVSQADKLRHDFQDYDIIGHMAKPEVGAALVTPDGIEIPIQSQE